MARIITISFYEYGSNELDLFKASEELKTVHLFLGIFSVCYPDGKCEQIEGTGNKAKDVANIINGLDEKYEVQPDQIALFIRGKIDELVLLKK